MKHLIIAAVLLFSVLTFSSCQKDWNCKTTTKTDYNLTSGGEVQYQPGDSRWMAPVIVYSTTSFSGTEREKEDYENAFTNKSSSWSGSRTVTVTQTCDCH